MCDSASVGPRMSTTSYVPWTRGSGTQVHTTLRRDFEDLLETKSRLLCGLGASGSGMSERSVVPAMLPNSGLPDEYSKPE